MSEPLKVKIYYGNEYGKKFLKVLLFFLGVGMEGGKN